MLAAGAGAGDSGACACGPAGAGIADGLLTGAALPVLDAPATAAAAGFALAGGGGSLLQAAHASNASSERLAPDAALERVLSCEPVFMITLGPWSAV